MEKKKTKPQKKTKQMEKPIPNEPEQIKPVYNAMDRSRAVLSVWTERQRPSQVCRELSIPQAVLRHWQGRALEGMLQALEPRVKLVEGIALSPRLQVLLERQQRMLENRRSKTTKLETRLNNIRDARSQQK